MKTYVGAGLAISAIFLLGGCSAINSLPGVHLGGGSGPAGGDTGSTTAPTDDGTSTTPATADLSCINGQVIITTSDSIDTVHGTCAQVILDGSNIRLTSEGINRLTISGDNDTVTSTQVGALTVAGQTDTIKAAGFGPVTISGNGSSVTSTGTITSVVLEGNNNSIVSTNRISSVIQSGSGNKIGKG